MLRDIWNPGQTQVRFFAGLSCIGWIMMFGMTGAGLTYVGCLFGLVYHLSLAPVVSQLRAPEWVRMAGYVWIFCDATLDVVRIHGLSEDIIWAFRMGIHIAAAMWITGVSIHLPRRMMIPGCVLGISLALHAIVAPYLPDADLVLGASAIPLMIIWLSVIAFSYVPQKDAQTRTA